MKKEMKFYGIVENGKLKLNEPYLYNSYKNTLKGNVYVVIGEAKKKRTLSQNSLYWVYVSALAEVVSCSPQEMHDTLKLMFNSRTKYVKTINNQMVEFKVINSTTGLTTTQFKEYLDRVIQLAAENGIVLDAETRV